METVSFPRGLPPRVRVTHQAVLVGPQVAALINWPPQPPNGHQAFPIRPIFGFRVPPHHHVGVMVGLRASHPGTHVVGPVTFHAQVLQVPGLPNGTVPASESVNEYAVLCAGVSRARCQSAMESAGH
jgi:hypothetical protein